MQVDLSGATWRRSSASGPYGDNCVEVAVWHKSSASPLGQDCVEVAADVDGVAVRHSKDPDGPTLLFTRSEWRAFVAGVKGGEFDL